MRMTSNRVVFSLEQAKELSTRVAMRAEVAERRRQKAVERKKANSAKKQAQSRSRNRERREVFQKLLAHTINDEESIELINPSPETMLFLKEIGFKYRVAYRRKQERDILLRRFEELNDLIKPLVSRLAGIAKQMPDAELKKSKTFVYWARDYPKTYERYGQAFEDLEGLVDLLCEYGNQTFVDDGFARFGDPPPEVLIKGLQVLYERLTGREFDRLDYLDLQGEVYKLERKITSIREKLDSVVADPDFIHESSINQILEVPLRFVTPNSDDADIEMYAHCLNWAGCAEGRLFYSAISTAIRTSIIRREKKLLIEISDVRGESNRSILSSDYYFPGRKRSLRGPPSQLARLMLAPLGFSTIVIKKTSGQGLELSGW